MSHMIKVTGFIEVEDDEFDPNPDVGPLTEAADMEYRDMRIGSLDDLEFTLEDES